MVKLKSIGQAITFNADPGTHFLALWDNDRRAGVFRLSADSGETFAVECLLNIEDKYKIVRCASIDPEDARERIKRGYYQIPQ